jgi:hypothetical protein
MNRLKAAAQQLDTNNAATVLKLAQVAIIDLCYSYTLYG